MSAPLDKRISALMELNPEKYSNKEIAREHLKKHAKVDFVSAGVIVVDIKTYIGIGKDIKEGSLAVISEDLSAKLISTITSEELKDSVLGGIGNVALPASALGINTGIVGYVGDDRLGKHFLRKIQKYGVYISGVITEPEYNTDFSYIPQDRNGSRAGIKFCESAGKHFDLTNKRIMEIFYLLNPKIVQISYSGLFEEGADRDGGKKLAEGIRLIKDNLDSLVMVDTHTYTGKLERYDYLKPALEVSDMFICSYDEARLISERFYIKSGETKEDKIDSFLSYLEEHYCKGDSARLYAVTTSETISILYYKPNKQTERIKFDNWFTTTIEHIYDTTGAGDSFKAGLNSYILNHLQEFKEGTINIQEAVQFANLIARLYISEKGIEAFKGYDYYGLIRSVSKDKKPTGDLVSKEGLYEALDSFTRFSII